MKHKNHSTERLILAAGQGRVYQCGRMMAIFKADENETAEKYSISEWWLEPHSHEVNDEVFYVLEGTTTILIGDDWIDAEKGTFVRIPSKTIHDFKNQTDRKTGVLNLFIPGGFERNMPSIVDWFDQNK